jgi:hypothetical protein
MTFVKFIQDDHSSLAKLTVTQELPGQNTLCEIPKPGPAAADLLESNLIPYRFSEAFPKLIGDTFSGHARGKPARLQDVYMFQPGGQQRCRHASCFARARLRFEQCDRVVLNAFGYLRKQRVYRKRGLHHQTAISGTTRTTSL